MKGPAVKDMICPDWPRYRLIFDYSHINLWDEACLLNDELLEKLLELARARRDLDKVAGVIRVLLKHCFLYVLDDLVDYGFLRKIECPECSVEEVIR